MTVSTLAHEAGRRAGNAGLTVGANPYPAGSPEALDWQRGVHDAHEAAFRAADAAIKREREQPAHRPDQDLDIFGRPLRFGS